MLPLPTSRADAASQTLSGELAVNGSVLRSEAQEFVPAAGLPPPCGDVFFDAREWYAPVAAYPPVQFTQYAQPSAQPEPVEGTYPAAAGTPVQSTPSRERGSFVERTAKWISGRARAVALLFVAAATTLATKRDQLVQQFEDVFGGADAASKDHLMPPPMKGPPMQVHLKLDAVPSACLVPRKIPYALEEATRAELDRHGRERPDQAQDTADPVVFPVPGRP